MSLAPDALGRFGEAAAARLLRSKGFKILARNWSCPAGELDLVARRRRTLVFVEVKTRRVWSPYAPELAVDRRKIRRLRRAAAAYLRRHPFRHWAGVRFDVVAVTVDRADEVNDLRHLEDAF